MFKRVCFDIIQRGIIYSIPVFFIFDANIFAEKFKSEFNKKVINKISDLKVVLVRKTKHVYLSYLSHRMYK